MERASASDEEEPGRLVDLSGLRILVVDDDEDVRNLLAIVLGRCGAEVKLASSAEDAWNTFAMFRPDVVVSDLTMPGEDGCALVRRVRRLPRLYGGGAPVVAVTGSVRMEDRLRALAAGFDALLAKPVDTERLANLIATLAKGDVRRAAA